jgi:hypothetical protein
MHASPPLSAGNHESESRRFGIPSDLIGPENAPGRLLQPKGVGLSVFRAMAP